MLRQSEQNQLQNEQDFIFLSEKHLEKKELA